MQNVDFSKIVLTAEEQEIFTLFKNSDKAFLTVAQYKILSRTGFIKHCINGKSDWFDDLSDGICELSDSGKRYKEYLNQKARQSAQQKKEANHKNIKEIFFKIAGYILAYLLGLFSSEIKDFIINFFHH